MKLPPQNLLKQKLSILTKNRKPKPKHDLSNTLFHQHSDQISEKSAENLPPCESEPTTIFLSPQMKRCAIITYKHGMYELPNVFPNDLRLLEN